MLKIKAVASEAMQTGQAVIVEMDDHGRYVAKKCQTVGVPAATATEDIKVGDRVVFEDSFIRKAVGDEWSQLP